MKIYRQDFRLDDGREITKKQILDIVTSDDFKFNLNKDQAKFIRKEISQTIRQRWIRDRRLKCGKGNKSMTSDEVNHFFSQFKPHEYRYKTLFLTQALLGLRINEVLKIKAEDLDFNSKQIKINTLKKHGPAIDWLPLHDQIYGLLMDYCSEYEKEIIKHHSYIFFSDCYKGKGHISGETSRRKFAEIRERAGLMRYYGYYERRGPVPVPEKKLFYVTTHSLRHAFGKFLANNEVPPIVAKHLLRHDSITSTEVYYVPDKEVVDSYARKLFSKERQF